MSKLGVFSSKFVSLKLKKVKTCQNSCKNLGFQFKIDQNSVTFNSIQTEMEKNEKNSISRKDWN